MTGMPTHVEDVVRDVPGSPVGAGSSEPSKTFEHALFAWHVAAMDYYRVREQYRLAHGKAAMESTAKNAEGRKSEADAKTSELRAKRDGLGLEERVAFHRMIHLRGGVDDGERGNE